jgi:hypothetical protein
MIIGVGKFISHSQFFNQKSKIVLLADFGRDTAIQIGVNLTSNLVSVFCLSPQSFRAPLNPPRPGGTRAFLRPLEAGDARLSYKRDF